MSDMENVRDGDSSTALMPQRYLDDAAKKAAFSAEWSDDLFHEIRNAKARAFLAAYSILPMKTVAAKAAGCDPNMHWYWLEHIEGYPEAFVMAARRGADVVKREAFRRAVEGWDEDVYQGGKWVGTKRRFSDTLMERWLEATSPDEFMRRSRVEQQLSGPGGGPLQVQQHVIVQELSDEDLARIASAPASVGLPGALPMLPAGQTEDAETE